MRCFFVQVDPQVADSPNTKAYLYAVNEKNAKSWAGKRWCVSEKLIQAELVGRDRLPDKVKPITVPAEAGGKKAEEKFIRRRREIQVAVEKP